MADKKLLLIPTPAIADFPGPIYVKRWFKIAGDTVQKDENLVVLCDNLTEQARLPNYIMTSPADGVMDEIEVFAGQETAVGGTLCRLAVAADYRDTTPINWNNFDEVTDILEGFADRSKRGNERKNANDALGALLGIEENAVFQKMNIEQQNQFLQSLLSDYKSYGLNPAELANKLLEGLHLRTPQVAPATPAPVYGIGTPAPRTPGLGLGTSGSSARTITQTPPTDE